MGLIIRLALLAVKIWPIVYEAVHAAEAAFQVKGAGTQKLNAVLDGMETAYEITQGGAGVSSEQFRQVASSLVAKLVTRANDRGEFKTGTAVLDSPAS